MEVDGAPRASEAKHRHFEPYRADVPEETSHAVTCHDEGLSVVDLREWSFSCFMLVPVDEVGCPRKVPEDSHG